VDNIEAVVKLVLGSKEKNKRKKIENIRVHVSLAIVHVTRLCDRLGNSILSQMVGNYCQTETKQRKQRDGLLSSFCFRLVINANHLREN
jgi:hypothetical protein